MTWPGMLQADLKWGAFYASDVFALPSHQENFGVAVAEALACGLPVLLSDKVGVWREVENDRAGFVSRVPVFPLPDTRPEFSLISPFRVPRDSVSGGLHQGEAA